MSKPASGTYIIINRVLSPSGQKLAITFNGQGKFATATPLTNAANQRWIISDYDTKTQAVVPVDGKSLQAGWGDHGVIVLPAGGYVWTIRSSDSGYTIQDGGVTVYWGLNKAVNNENITIAAGRGDEKKDWILEKIA